MKRKILTLLMIALCTVTYAQPAYDENIDPIQQIDKAVSAAKASKKKRHLPSRWKLVSMVLTPH